MELVQEWNRAIDPEDLSSILQKDAGNVFTQSVG
jgi:hypothetical protein